MIVLEKYRLPEVVDRSEVERFKLKSSDNYLNVPIEVIQFIEAIDKKLGDFSQYGRERVHITGKDLLMCGMTEWYGERVDIFCCYWLNVPKMLVVDYKATMHRLFKRKGKQGLIDFCKAKVKETELEQVLEILSVQVFKQERPEFKRMLQQIEASKKIEPVISA
jgi:hypothetical protein